MKILELLLRSLALVSIEPIIFSSFFVGHLAGGTPSATHLQLYIIIALFSSPVLFIFYSVFRPCKIGNFFAYTSALTIVIPLGISSLITEKFFVEYNTYRVWILWFVFFAGIFLIKKYAVIECDEESQT